MECNVSKVMGGCDGVSDGMGYNARCRVTAVTRNEELQTSRGDSISSSVDEENSAAPPPSPLTLSEVSCHTQKVRVRVEKRRTEHIGKCQYDMLS